MIFSSLVWFPVVRCSPTDRFPWSVASITEKTMNLKTTLQNLGSRDIAFYAVVLIGIVIPVALFQIALTLPVLFPVIGQIELSMAGSPHLLHDVAFFGLIWAGLVGMLTQLFRPAKRIAGLQQTLVVLGAFLVGIAVMGPTVDASLFGELPFFAIIYGPAVVAALLHPAGRRLLRIRTAGRFNPVLAGLVVVAAIPLVAYMAEQFALQGSGDIHAQVSHYAGMFVYSGVLVALGLLASLKPAGWRTPLFTAAGMALLLGIASVVLPTLASSAGTMWGGAAIVWAALFAVAGEVSARKDVAQADVEPEPKARAG
jgi:hypothetical protein